MRNIVYVSSLRLICARNIQSRIRQNAYNLGSIFDVIVEEIFFIIRNCYKIVFYIYNMTIIFSSLIWPYLVDSIQLIRIYEITGRVNLQLVDFVACRWKSNEVAIMNGVFLSVFPFFFSVFCDRIVIFMRLSANKLLCRARGVYRRSESRHMIMVALRYAKSPILRQAFVLLKRFGS